MAYPPYNYNPYQNGYGQPLYPQTQYPQQAYMQTQQTKQGGSMIEVRYAKYEEAMPFLITEPDKKILFIITDKPMMVFKATDGMGISTTEQYETKKIDGSTAEPKAIEFNPKEYVKISDLKDFINEETLNKKLKEFNDSISKQIKDISTKMKIKEILGDDGNAKE